MWENFNSYIYLSNIYTKLYPVSRCHQAIVDVIWPGFAINYGDIWLVDNSTIIQLFNC